MTETVAERPAFDFSEVTGRVAKRLRKPKLAAVDPAVVKQAQRSFDGVPNEETGELDHILWHEFSSDEMAAEFARQMRLAGGHTTPATSITAVIDPEDTGNKRLVHWQAGLRRGAKPKAPAAAPSAS